MEIKDLETFLLIVETGSFTEAAKALFLTQPGVSRRIRHLEDELQCKLFEKVGNHLIVTPEGQELQVLAENLLQSVTQLKRTFERKRGRFSHITIVFSSTLAGTSFTARFQELKTAFPNVENFHLRILNDDQLSLSVLKGDSDIGIRFFPDENPQLNCHLLCNDPFLLVRSAKSQWFADGEDVTRKTLNAAPWVLLTRLNHYFDPITQVNQMTDAILKRLDIVPQQPIECYGWGVTKSLVEQGHGIGFLPSVKVRQEIDNGTFRALDLPIRPTIPIYGIHRKNDVHAGMWQEILAFLLSPKIQTQNQEEIK